MAAVCMSQYDTQLSAVRVRTVGTINYACMESAPTSPVSWRGLWWRAQALLVYRNAAIQLPNRPYLSRPRGGGWGRLLGPVGLLQGLLLPSVELGGGGEGWGTGQGFKQLNGNSDPTRRLAFVGNNRSSPTLLLAKMWERYAATRRSAG